MPILRVAIDIPLPQLFDYTAEDAQAEDIGRCVRVPFGNGEKIGVIVGLAASSEHAPGKLKPAGEILRDLPALPRDWIELCEFCSRYYQHPLVDGIAAVFAARQAAGKTQRKSNGANK